ERSGVVRRVNAQYEIQRIQHVMGNNDVGKCAMQEILLDSEALNIPTYSPDVQFIKDAEGRLSLSFHGFGKTLPHCAADFIDERLVGNHQQNSTDRPTDRIDLRNDLLTIVDEYPTILELPGCQPQLDGGCDAFVESFAEVVLLFPQRLGCVQRLFRQFGIEILQYSGRDRKRRDTFELVAGIPLSEDKPVILFARMTSCFLIKLERCLVEKVVGGVRQFANQRVLVQRWSNDSTIQPAEALVAAENGQHAVHNLLQRVRLAIGLVNLCQAPCLVNR